MKIKSQQRWTATSTRAAAEEGSAGLALRRLRDRAWAIVQTSVAAELAWFITHDVLGHRQPFFAPIAAVVCLSASTVMRAQRAVQMIIGVGFGIGVGVVVEAVLHANVFAVGVAVLITLCLSVVFGRGFIAQGLMFFNQTAISAILVVVLPNGGTGVERLFDALVGGGIALVFSVLLFPADPVALLRTALDSALAAMSGTLTHLDGVVDQHGREPVDAGWTTAEGEALNRSLAGVAEARATARQVIRAAPRRRGARPVIERLERQATQITVLAGALLNLARAVTAAVRSGEELPEGLHAAISDLNAGLSGLASHDTAAASRAATRAVGRMVDQQTASPNSAPLIAALSESAPHTE